MTKGKCFDFKANSLNAFFREDIYHQSDHSGEFVRKNTSFIILVSRNASQRQHPITDRSLKKQFDSSYLLET